MTTGVAIPNLGCPFPLRLHPDVDQIETEAAAWAARVGLGGYERARFGWLGAACYPHSTLDGALLATNVLQWIFAFDDYLDEPAVADRWRMARQALLSVRVVEDPDHLVGAELEPCLAALDDIVRRLRAAATPAQYQRFLAGLTEWVLGQVCGDVADTTIRLADYTTVRRYNTNGLMSFALIDITSDAVLPDEDEEWLLLDEEWLRPDVMWLTRAASDIVGYTNDVYSWAKEHARDPDAVHLPSMLAQLHDVTLAEGAARAADHVSALYTRFQDAASCLRAGASPALVTYLTGLEAWLAGQHHWCAHTHRYATSETS